MSYKVEIIEKKDPIKQLEASKSSIKDLFNDLLNKAEGFKYQITLKVMLKKYNPTGEIEFRPVYFNSTAKTVINHKVLTNLFKKFCTGLITGLMKDLVRLLNQSYLSTLIFQLIDHYQEVLAQNYLLC